MVVDKRPTRQLSRGLLPAPSIRLPTLPHLGQCRRVVHFLATRLAAPAANKAVPRKQGSAFIAERHSESWEAVSCCGSGGFLYRITVNSRTDSMNGKLTDAHALLRPRRQLFAISYPTTKNEFGHTSRYLWPYW